MFSTGAMVTELKGDVDPILTGKERREILSKLHLAHASNIITAVLESSVPAMELTFEAICDLVPSFMEDYRYLRLFDQISELRKKKDMIQQMMRNYVNQVVAGTKFSSLAHFVTVMASGESAFGLSQFVKIYQQIKTNNEFPTFLEALDGANDELRSNIRGLDILFHLPSEIALTQKIRTVIFEIDKEFKKLQKKPAQIEHAKPVPGPTQPRKSPMPSAAASAIPAVGQLFGQIDKMKKSVITFKAYLEEIVDHNMRTHTNLFYLIVSGADSTKIAEILAKTPNATTITDTFGNSALHLAAIAGDEKVMQLLVSNGFSLSKKNAKGNTPLHLAVGAEKEAIVRLLLAHGVECQQNNDDGYDPFILAMLGKKDNPICLLFIESRGFNHQKLY